jgi:hypothetical protein
MDFALKMDFVDRNDPEAPLLDTTCKFAQVHTDHTRTNCYCKAYVKATNTDYCVCGHSHAAHYHETLTFDRINDAIAEARAEAERNLQWRKYAYFFGMVFVAINCIEWFALFQAFYLMVALIGIQIWLMSVLCCCIAGSECDNFSKYITIVILINSAILLALMINSFLKLVDTSMFELR